MRSGKTSSSSIYYTRYSKRRKNTALICCVTLVALGVLFGGAAFWLIQSAHGPEHDDKYEFRGGMSTLLLQIAPPVENPLSGKRLADLGNDHLLSPTTALTTHNDPTPIPTVESDPSTTTTSSPPHRRSKPGIPLPLSSETTTSAVNTTSPPPPTDNSFDGPFSTMCHVTQDLPINPRTGKSAFNIALSPAALSVSQLRRVYTTSDQFCTIGNDGVPRVANPLGKNNTMCRGRGGKYAPHEMGVKDDEGDIPVTTTYISKYERQLQERGRGADQHTPPPVEVFGITTDELLLASTDAATNTHQHHIYVAAGRWASAAYEIIAYSQVVIGYLSVQLSPTTGSATSKWIPLGALPSTLSTTNTHRLATFIMSNFRHDMFPPRVGIEDVIVFSAWNRFFVLGNVGFSFGHAQPFIGEVTSRVLHQGAEGRNNVFADVSSYENEWLPTVDDPQEFGLKEGNPAKNNPHRVEKNWNAFPCYWRPSGLEKDDGGDSTVFIEGEQSPPSNSTIVCLQRNIAPRVETFAFDLRRQRVVHKWESASNKFSTSARGGKGVVRLQTQEGQSKSSGLLVARKAGRPRGGGVDFMITLAHNVASHYGLTWLLQDTESPFNIIAVIGADDPSRSFSLYRQHFAFLGKTSPKVQQMNAEIQQKLNENNNGNRRRNTLDIKPTRAPTLVEFVKSISGLNSDWIIFSHSVEDDTSIMCTVPLKTLLQSPPPPLLSSYAISNHLKSSETSHL